MYVCKFGDGSVISTRVRVHSMQVMKVRVQAGLRRGVFCEVLK